MLKVTTCTRQQNFIDVARRIAIDNRETVSHSGHSRDKTGLSNPAILPLIVVQYFGRTHMPIRYNLANMFSRILEIKINQVNAGGDSMGEKGARHTWTFARESRM